MQRDGDHDPDHGHVLILLVEDPQRVGTDEHQPKAGDGQARDLDRDAAPIRPVHVLEVKDEGELVEQQRRADTNEEAGDDGPRRVEVDDDGSERPDNQEEDTGNCVVDMDTARGDVVLERAAVPT